ncbi:MAG: electron transfer flavoprotein subunit alpha/FixB family protein [Sphingobacteriales bacterium]|nr:MAG: electron transfer flavoprotein subunit alpha/FixB family protein [Sphingobacteriales bacterium]
MVLILAEHTATGTFKKKALEAVQYGAQIASKMGTEAVALVIGSGEGNAAELGAYGVQKVLQVTDARLKDFNARAYTKAIVAAAEKIGAKVIVASHDQVGLQVAPRVAMRLNAGIIAGAIGFPELANGGFTVRKAVFAGKAFADVSLTTDVKVLTLMANTFPVQKGEGSATVEKLDVAFDDKDFGVKVQSTQVVSGTVPLSEAELVVSGGRGMKGPENWGALEDLASALGASLACSRPVADSHWRPHNEHVGQTGGTIRPNLYIAAGISGAIQHLAGVNGSKTIVVINKDPEAPFFKAADYGVVGDVLEILPRLTEAVKKFKAAQ